MSSLITANPSPAQKPKLLDRLRDAIRVRHYSMRTEHAYTQWVRRFILFHNKRHPDEMGRVEVEAFLTHLAVEGHVAAATQNQALNAIVFLYKEVLKRDNREWGAQYVFPASRRSVDPRSGVVRRHHLDPSMLQRAVKRAVRTAGLTKPATCHTFRHPPAGQRVRHQNRSGVCWGIKM